MANVQRPLIGIGADLARDEQSRPRHQVRATYVDAVVRAGGVPVILPASAEARCAALDRLDGVVVVGGDDIDTRPFGVPLHPMARVMDPERQSAELAMLAALDARPAMPVLGICLGMQLMFDRSEEFGDWPGLGLLPGVVRAIPPVGTDGVPHKVPHIGWNGLRAGSADWSGSVLDGVAQGSTVYFVHSYAVHPADPSHRVADADYDGQAICAVVRRGNLHGCQFHPERSGETGLAIVRNFLRLPS